MKVGAPGRWNAPEVMDDFYSDHPAIVPCDHPTQSLQLHSLLTSTCMLLGLEAAVEKLLPWLPSREDRCA